MLQTIGLLISILATSLSGIITKKFNSSSLWSSYADTTFTSGDGSEASPYTITTPEQLAGLAKLLDGGNHNSEIANYNSKYYVLGNDIDLSANDWTGIGIPDDSDASYAGKYVFYGHFNGNGKTVSGINIKQNSVALAESNKNRVVNGFFGCIGTGASISNLTLTYGTVYISNSASNVNSTAFGFLAGEAIGTNFDIHDVNINLVKDATIVLSNLTVSTGAVVAHKVGGFFGDLELTGTGVTIFHHLSITQTQLKTLYIKLPSITSGFLYSALAYGGFAGQVGGVSNSLLVISSRFLMDIVEVSDLKISFGSEFVGATSLLSENFTLKLYNSVLSLRYYTLDATTFAPFDIVNFGEIVGYVPRSFRKQPLIEIISVVSLNYNSMSRDGNYVSISTNNHGYLVGNIEEETDPNNDCVYNITNYFIKGSINPLPYMGHNSRLISSVIQGLNKLSDDDANNAMVNDYIYDGYSYSESLYQMLNITLFDIYDLGTYDRYIVNWNSTTPATFLDSSKAFVIARFHDTNDNPVGLKDKWSVVDYGHAYKIAAIGNPVIPTGGSLVDWFLDKTHFINYDPGNIWIDGYITYYAYFEFTRTISYELDGGVINSGFITSYVEGSNVTLPSDVTKDGYTFDGWYRSDSFIGSKITKISSTDTGDKTYYAKWIPNKVVIVYPHPDYKIAFNENGGVINDLEVINTYKTGDKIVLPKNVTKTGYTFAGWYSSKDLRNTGPISELSYLVVGDFNFYAKWVLDTRKENEVFVSLRVNGHDELNIEGFYKVGTIFKFSTNLTQKNYKMSGYYTSITSQSELISEVTVPNNDLIEVLYPNWMQA